MQSEPRYKVGDRVIIAEEGVIDSCVFGVAEEMYDYSGSEAVILDVGWAPGTRAYRYRLNIDDQEWSWCENCFVPVEKCPDLPEFEANDISIFF